MSVPHGVRNVSAVCDYDTSWSYKPTFEDIRKEYSSCVYSAIYFSSLDLDMKKIDSIKDVI